MGIQSNYLQAVFEGLKNRNANEPEYLQAVYETLRSLPAVVEHHPELQKAGIIERFVEPERIIAFRVSWVDDAGRVQVNRGYRVQFNSAVGPYKGGLRFHPSVNLSIMKFLAFEQTLKNSLTDLPMGGAKGGSDFDPRGRSDGEIMRFCQAFMAELFRHIGENTDIPAGDLGVGTREIGYLFGQYRRLRNEFSGTLTGKGLSFGGSSIRPEATGYGAVYFANEMMRVRGDSLAGKRVAVSGFGNVAWGTCRKLAEIGAKVVTISGPDGYVYDPEGVSTPEKHACLLEMRASGRDRAEDYANRFGCAFFANEKPWGREDIDAAMPCATQNEITLGDAEKLVQNGVKYLIEVSNMSSTAEATSYLQGHGVLIGPSKAVNAGGVVVSCFEMSQNAAHISWFASEVDEKLSIMMKRIHDRAAASANEYGLGYNLVDGANIAGFLKVADAMLSQGVC